jgi:hypothetical protein
MYLHKKMPYCRKCGVELDEDAKFCPVCGTPVTPQVTRIRREERRPLDARTRLAIFLIVLIVSATIIIYLGFSPVHTIEKSWRGSASHQTGDTLVLSLTADIAHVKVSFEDLTDERVVLDASATARAGFFVSPNSLERFRPVSTFAIGGNVLTVTVRQAADTTNLGWPPYESLNVTYHIRIDPSLNATLNIVTSTGGIVLDTQSGVVFNSMSLEAITGGVRASLVEDVVVSGDVSVKATTGGVELSWDNVILTKNVLVSATTITGGVDVSVKQDEGLLGNVTINAEATTGGVDFAIEIQGDIGAKITSRVTTGAINVDRQIGFSLMYADPSEEGLWSENWKTAGSNFYVSLKTTTGGINIDAQYTP